MLKHLRRVGLRLLLAFCGVVVGTLVALAFGGRIIEALTVPVRSALADGAHGLSYTNAHEPFMLVAFKGPFYGGVFLATPWVLWQLWLLLAPERHRRKRRVALPMVALATALFYGGAAFAYGVVLPRTLPRMLTVLEPITGLHSMLSVDAMTALVVKSMIGFGLAFELPMVGALAAIIARATWRGEAPTNPSAPPSVPPSP